MLDPKAVSIAHINADYPANDAQDIYSLHRSSDHDPVWVRFGLRPLQTWLPLVIH
jgi:hypothetical protein